MAEAPDPRASREDAAGLRRRVAALERQVEKLRGKEQAAEREKEQLFRVLLNMPVMVDAFDAEGNIVLWNRECERVTGYAAEEIIGNRKAMEWLYPNPAYRERMMREWQERGDDYRHWPWELMAKDGSVKIVAWYNISRHAPMAPWKTWGIGVEITEQRRAEGALQESERRLREVFENMPIGIYHTSPDGRALMANPAFMRMLGYRSLAELARQNLEALSVDARYPRSAFRQRLEREGRVLGFESTWRRRDGSALSTLENARIVRDEHGRVLYYEGTIEDITERARMEAAVRESENRYRTLVESAGESISVVDEEGVFLFLNTTAAERLGGKSEDYIGKKMGELFPGAIAERQLTSIRTVIRTGRGLNVIVPTILRGQARWYNTTIEPLSGGDGGCRAALVVARDIHELRQAQKELEEYRGRMAQAERLASLGTLSAMVAHQMNQPLTVLRLGLQNCLAQLESEGASAGAVEDLQDCLEGLAVASGIVDRFRSFARHSAERRPGRANLHRVAERVVGLFEEAAARRRVRLVLEGLDRLGERRVDERDLEQVFFSLMENAIQAADGAADHELRITGAAQGDGVELRFADDCGGIAPEHVDRIFTPFFTTKGDKRATGLGLCIVEQALSTMGGKIRVENQPGQGVTFVITLPARIPG